MTAPTSHAKQYIKIAADNCIFTVREGKLQVLLIQMKKKPFTGRWALPGGLIGNRERLLAAAEHVLKLQTGVTGVYLEQLFTFDTLDRDPFGRVVSSAYMALVPDTRRELKPNPKYSAVQWLPISKLPHLAYDHDSIVAYAIERLRAKLEYTNVAWSLLPAEFTLTELQQIYETVLNRRLDKRNFRKKILELKLLATVSRKAARGAHRPAQLYRCRSRRPQILQVL